MICHFTFIEILIVSLRSRVENEPEKNRSYSGPLFALPCLTRFQITVLHLNRELLYMAQKIQMRHVQETSVTLLSHISIPIELLEEILRCGWFSPMFGMEERIVFMTAAALVSKTWLEVLLRIICRDVYITHNRQFIIKWSTFFHKLVPEISPSQLCRTITRQIPVSGKTRHGRSSHFQGKSIQNMLSTFHGLSLMPNLRSLTVEYYNPAFGRNESFPFCASIIQLHLEYTFDSDCPRWLMDALLASQHSTSKRLPWAPPHLEHISTPVNEGPITSIIEVLNRCPHLQLAEERVTIRVHILSASRRAPKNCIIFHGIMPSFDAGVISYSDFGPKTVRGSASALLIKVGDRACESSIDLPDMFRNVQVFVHNE